MVSQHLGVLTEVLGLISCSCGQRWSNLSQPLGGSPLLICDAREQGGRLIQGLKYS
jgi:hypothetical protein